MNGALKHKVASAIEDHFEKHIHMARRLYPDVWKLDVAEVAMRAMDAALDDNIHFSSCESEFIMEAGMYSPCQCEARREEMREALGG